jgi:hypothetical protein
MYRGETTEGGGLEGPESRRCPGDLSHEERQFFSPILYIGIAGATPAVATKLNP